MAKYTGAFPTKTIKKGSKGTNVTRWQNFLKWMGYSLKADSIFGSITREKTIACQKKLGFTGKAVDGIVGPKTIAKAKAYDKATPQKTKKCIDVSYWQGKISVENWRKVLKTCEYAICRASYTNQKSFKLNKDSTFAANFVNAKAAGLKVGAYHYSQAITVAEAKAEAEYLCQILKDFTPTFYVVCDFEYGGRLNSKIGKKASDIANAFCDVVKAHGYEPCIYANTSTLNSNLTNPKYPVWVAQYNDKCTYGGAKVMWQYTSSGSVEGISGRVDLSHVYEVPPRQLTKPEKAVAWAKEIAKSEEYTYKKWDSKDAKTKQCPICHVLTGKYKGWNCIGFVSAAYFHGGGIPVTCSCSGLGTDGLFDNVTEESWKKRNGENWKMISNGGKKNGTSIDASKLQEGDALLCYDDDGDWKHIVLYSGDGKYIDDTNGKTPNIAERSYSDLIKKRHVTRAFRYTG